jgi:hypothetical protein
MCWPRNISVHTFFLEMRQSQRIPKANPKLWDLCAQLRVVMMKRYACVLMSHNDKTNKWNLSDSENSTSNSSDSYSIDFKEDTELATGPQTQSQQLQ